VSLALFLSIFIVSTSQTFVNVEIDEFNKVDVPQEFSQVCGLELKRAVRKYCREKIIEKFLEKEPVKIIIMKTYKKCVPDHMEKCCKSKCTIATFVKLCPYRYHRR
jgi:hypothetical protein